MPELWFWLLAGMLAVYATLDGLDFGVGILHFFVGRTAAERTTLLASIGPVWDGNEVWLVAAGGTLFAAFPALYAAAFSGFYLPLMIVLWLLLFRGLGIEIRHQIHDPMWHQFWDVAFSAASLLLAVFFGAALGNLVRGVPLDASGDFFEPLWTNFRVGERTGILDWYTVLVGLTATATLALHGALWLELKTEGALAARAEQLAKRLWWAVLALGGATAFATPYVQPQLLQNVAQHPFGLILPISAFFSLLAARRWLRSSPLRAFLASSAHVFFQVLSAAFAIFPHALPARPPGVPLSIRAAAANSDTLTTMLWWWLPGMLIAASYSYFSFSRMPAKFQLGDTGH